MFKKKKLHVEQAFFSVAIISNEDLADEQYDNWTDEVMDTVDNVGSTTWMRIEDWDARQVNVLAERFPDVRMKETFFVVNEIIAEDIQLEVKELEKRHLCSMRYHCQITSMLKSGLCWMPPRRHYAQMIWKQGTTF